MARGAGCLHLDLAVVRAVTLEPPWQSLESKVVGRRSDDGLLDVPTDDGGILDTVGLVKREPELRHHLSLIACRLQDTGNRSAHCPLGRKVTDGKKDAARGNEPRLLDDQHRHCLRPDDESMEALVRRSLPGCPARCNIGEPDFLTLAGHARLRA
jgi:hypothetical protein